MGGRVQENGTVGTSLDGRSVIRWGGPPKTGMNLGGDDVTLNTKWETKKGGK